MSIWDDFGDLISDGVDYVVENPGKTMLAVGTVAAIAYNPAAWAAVAGRIGLTEAAIAVTAASAATVATNAANQKESPKNYERGYERGKEEGRKAGESTANQKYQEKINELTKRFAHYRNFDRAIVAMYSIGLALADKDRYFWNEHLENLEIITGLSSNKLPQHIQDAIVSLKQNPPTWERALNIAKQVKLPKSDIDEIVDVIASVGDYSNSDVTSIWQSSSKKYQFEVGA